MSEIIQDAAGIVNDRQVMYGETGNNIKDIAVIASAILKRAVTGEEVVVIMLATKIARQRYKHNIDNIHDIIGYARAWGIVCGEHED